MTDSTRTDATSSPHHSYPCPACGARVEFAPGAGALHCPYCGHQQAVAAPAEEVREHSFDALATLPRKPAASVGAYVFHCSQCGAQTESSLLADRCQFCAGPVVADPAAVELIAPEATVPFQVDHNGVRTALRQWVSSRWFAPSGLKKVRETESLKGTYIPYWTFDADTVTTYRGERGEYYWVTETYTVRVNGRSETRTRRVRKTRWYLASGTVQRTFDDVLVPATTHLTPKQLDRLAPWPLEQAVRFHPDYLAGHHAQRYDIEPEAGLDLAKRQMEPVIVQDCRRDIGGDEQRIHSTQTQYSNVTYKLMLLPVWIACYVYSGKNWQVLVNGVTGKVIGERPYSVFKIVLAISVAVLVILAIIAGVTLTG